MRYVLTEEERRAIASLKRLAKRWPKSLMLFSASGTLAVVPTDRDRDDHFEEWVIARVNGIPNDGGDPW